MFFWGFDSVTFLIVSSNIFIKLSGWIIIFRFVDNLYSINDVGEFETNHCNIYPKELRFGKENSFHVSHCTKSIAFSQALRFNRICSENAIFDKWCNESEVWLKEISHSDKLVRGQILKARKFLWSEVLNKQKRVGNKNRLFSILLVI